ncbi:MAG: ImmA/IrrE family metallo-endopeptidase [Pseudooceanicola nanhaiensis]
MNLDRINLADIHAPRRLGQALHAMLGPIDGAVPIVDIAQELDIAEVRLDVFDGFEGMLLTDRRRSDGSILANTSRGERRARFTVAHELGHFLMERHKLSDTDGFRCMPADMRETRAGRQHFRQELEANLFAIEALAPVAMVKPYLAGSPDLRVAQQMRDRLDISLEACIRRILDLSPEPLAAVWSKNGRVRYPVRTKAFPFVTCAKGQPLPQTSPAFRAVNKGTTGFTDMIETHGLAWTGESDLQLREQTRVARNGHAVTLLWANIPDEDEEDDGGLPELGTPRFR